MNKAAIALGYILVVLGAVSMIAPFLWMAAVSFMTDSQIFSFPPGFIPHPFTFANYANIFEKLPVTRFFLNSLFVALITTFFQVLFSAMAGFAFARGSFRHKDLLFFMFLVTMMIPPQVNIIPLFFLMRELHLIDTYQALILPGVFGGFGVFLMRQWFKSMSSEIEDAAKIVIAQCPCNPCPVHVYNHMEQFYVAFNRDKFSRNNHPSGGIISI